MTGTHSNCQTLMVNGIAKRDKGKSMTKIKIKKKGNNVIRERVSGRGVKRTEINRRMFLYLV